MNKKEKKRLQRIKNLKHRLLFLHVSRVLGNVDDLAAPPLDLERSREEEEKKKKKEEVVWSAKVQEIRNRITDKKRQAQDRWNRFSGTSDGGGRGR